ncbi:MAG: S46 family peptidase [Bacteroidaceae bacterium]|nr:S46 family peptidase [Bacteroidaceae bacterium]
MRKFLLTLTAVICSLLASADEGMWMLSHINPKTAQKMKELGLVLTPEQLYNPEGRSLKEAVINLGDFCSGVVVSPEGLFFTNHHCGYGAIQALSTPEDDILKNGFVAKKREQERPARGLYVRFLDRVEDCTERVNEELSRLYKEKAGVMDSAQVESAYIDSICVELEREFMFEKRNKGLDCRVASYYGGNAFYANFYKVYHDIRLVFTATETLGKFGGDTDNWMWPRQTCDFSMFRIYAKPDGTPAEYSEDNVPLKTPGYAPVSIKGYAPGDYCMTIGYPGSTDRYLSSWGIVERTEATNQAVIDVRTAKQNVWKHWMDGDRAIELKYSSKWARSSNYWKNSIGMNKAVKDLDVVGQKQKVEESIRQWYAKDESLKAQYGLVLPALEKAYTERKANMALMTYFSEVFMRGIELRSLAGRLSRLPIDASSEDASLCVHDLKAIYKDYEPRVDEETMGTLLQDYRKWSGNRFLPRFYLLIDSVYAGDTKAYAKDVFAKTCLLDTTCVAKVIADSTQRDTDMAMQYADALVETYYEILASVRSTMATIDYNERLLTKAIIEMDTDNAHYSNANMTMRLSYGSIKDYTAGSTHYNYFTNHQSLLDKIAQQKEIADYVMEPEITKLLKKGKFGKYKDKNTKQMHLCFLSNNDITGGNSGSPMFDANGHVIGLAFDGNWEAMAGDISFDPSLQRCIGVDIRFVLWIIDSWGGGKNIIKELGL